MSGLIKFELKKEHVALIKNIVWDENVKLLFDNPVDPEGLSPFGGTNLDSDMKLILVGKPQGNFDPLSDEEPSYTEEQQEIIDKMWEYYNELPRALEVTSYLNTFELGHYKRNWYVKNWKKYTPKKQA